MNSVDEATMEARLIAVIVVVLRDFESHELAAFNCAATGFNCIPPENLAYDRALKAELIDIDGSLKTAEETKRALAHVIAKRIEAGTFV